jgi:hypothetical protein
MPGDQCDVPALAERREVGCLFGAGDLGRHWADPAHGKSEGEVALLRQPQRFARELQQVAAERSDGKQIRRLRRQTCGERHIPLWIGRESRNAVHIMACPASR